VQSIMREWQVTHTFPAAQGKSHHAPPPAITQAKASAATSITTSIDSPYSDTQRVLSPAHRSLDGLTPRSPATSNPATIVHEQATGIRGRGGGERRGRGRGGGRERRYMTAQEAAHTLALERLHDYAASIRSLEVSCQ